MLSELPEANDMFDLSSETEMANLRYGIFLFSK